MPFAQKLGRLVFGSAERVYWQHHAEFLMAAVAFTNGIFSLSSFPYVYSTNGGDASLVPYLFFTMVLGVPLTCLELSIGQFNSAGVLSSWRVVPFFQGIGVSMMVLSVATTLLYSTTIAVNVYYLFASFSSELPWAQCNRDWSLTGDTDCDNYKKYKRSCKKEGWTIISDGLCYDDATRQYTSFDQYNSTPYVLYEQKSAQYLYGQVLRDPDQRPLEDLGPVVGHLALCSLLSWVLVAICLSRSAKSYGKVCYITTLLPLCLMGVFFVYGLTLDGHYEGVRILKSANMTAISKNYKSWGNSVSSVFFGLKFGTGGLTTLASYNRFHADPFRDSLIICSVHVFISIFGAFTAFFYYGAYAFLHDWKVKDVFLPGGMFIYSQMPGFFTTTSTPVLWSILWFLMLTCFAIGTQFCFAETVVTGIIDAMPKLRRFRPIVLVSVCACLYLLGLPFLAEGCTSLSLWLSINLSTWGLLLVPLAQITALLFYGLPRFLGDLGVMVGRRTCRCLPVAIAKAWVGASLLLPTCAAILFYHVCIQIDDELYTPEWPLWGVRLGKAITWVVPVILIMGALLSVIHTAGSGKWRKDMFSFLTPPKTWGPALAENRALVLSYVPWFTVHPNGTPDIGSQTTLDDILTVPSGSGNNPREEPAMDHNGISTHF